jgi:type IV secretory pathway VirB6-like protein
MKNNALILLFFLLLICGCSTGDRGCREGDNFDGNATEIQSKFDPNDPYYLDESGKQFTDNYSLVKWQDTGLLTNGKPIVLDIDGKWSSWGREPMFEEYFDVENGKEVVKYREVESVCRNFLKKDVLVPGLGPTEVGRYILIYDPARNNGGFPCWLTNGMGLYLLFKDSSDPKPNSSTIVNESPVSGTIHLNSETGETNNRFVVNIDDVKNGEGVPVFSSGEIKKGIEIWAKIYDSYYPDNYGAYKLNFVEGVFKRQKNPIFEKCYEYIMKDIIGTSKSIFIAVTNDSMFKTAVNLMLVIFITMTGILFVLGFIQMSAAEVFIRVFKVGLIAVLLNPGAWEFFYNYLFKAYLEGMIEMCGIIISSDKFDPEQPMAFLDDLSSKILNPYITNRMAALINANLVLGVLWFFVLAMILFFFSLTLIISFASFIIAMILLYFITMVFPIFIIFILFNYTKTFFQQWVDAVLGYSMQIILTFVSLAFMAEIIQIQVQKILGFRMCVAATYHFNPFTDASGSDTDNSFLTIKQWAPGENDWYSPITFWGIIIPGYNIYELFVKVHYKFDLAVEKILIPPRYKEYRYRYKSLPFLEPDENYDVNSGPPSGYENCNRRKTKENCHPDKLFPNGTDQSEHDRIIKMMFNDKNNSYEFVSFMDLFAVIILIFISWRINIDVIPALSYTIAIVQKDFIPPEMYGMTAMQNTYKNVLGGLHRMSQSENAIVSWMGKIPMMIMNADALFAQMTALRKGVGKSDQYQKVMEKLGLNDLDKRIFGQKISGVDDFIKLTPAERYALTHDKDGMQLYTDQNGRVFRRGDDLLFDKNGNPLMQGVDADGKSFYKDMNGNIFKEGAAKDGIYKDAAGNILNEKDIEHRETYRDNKGNIKYKDQYEQDLKWAEQNGKMMSEDALKGSWGMGFVDAVKSYEDFSLRDKIGDNRFGRAAFQVTDAIKDSIGILTDRENIRNEAINVENLRVMHKWQDEIGGRIEFAEAKIDKFAAHALGKALDPTHSSAKDLFGGSDFSPLRDNKPESQYTWGENPFRKLGESVSHSFERKEGLVGNLANAFAGDLINEWAHEKGFVKEGELVFNNKETVSGALDQFFHEDKKGILTGSYNKIADSDFDEYMTAINRGWENRLDARDINNEKKDLNKIPPGGGSSPSGGGSSPSGGGSGPSGGGSGPSGGGSGPSGVFSESLSSSSSGGSDSQSNKDFDKIPPGGGGSGGGAGGAFDGGGDRSFASKDVEKTPSQKNDTQKNKSDQPERKEQSKSYTDGRSDESEAEREEQEKQKAKMVERDKLAKRANELSLKMTLTPKEERELDELRQKLKSFD